MALIKRSFFSTGAFVCLAIACYGETLTVRVVDAKSGAPVMASINAIGTLPRVESARTNEQGVAVLDVPSFQQLFLVVRSSTHGEKCLGEEETKEGVLVVRMEPSLRVFGVVRDPGGNPLRQATVKVVYKEDPKCRIRFDRPAETTNERGEYVMRNVDVTRDATIVVRHDLYAERAITKSEISTAPSGPTSNTKEMDVYLMDRP